jgi:formylglycine-generating enzyme required for sulfatase activity
MVRVEGGEFLMGTNDPIGFPADGEEPVRAVTLKPFWIDAYVVTNTRFAAFVEAPGYITSTSPSAQCCAMMCKRVQKIPLR